MRHLIISILLTFPMVLSAQLVISGKIIDGTSGKGLEGATINTPDGKNGTISNPLGQFQVLTLSDSLIISYVGYQAAVLTPLIDGGYYQVELRPDAELAGVTVTARAPEVGIRSPIALVKLPAKALARFQDLSPEPALNQASGVFMQTGTLNTNRITIRGIGNRSPFGTAKIRAYLDEIPLTNGVGETTIEDIDLSLIDRITVYKGPTASIYGAGLGGMIHLQTDPARASTSRVQAGLQVGDFGLTRTTLTNNYTDPAGKLQLQLNYNKTKSDGYRSNNAYDRESFTVIGRQGGNSRHRSTVLANFNSVKAFIPSSLNENDFRNDPQKAAFTWAQVKGFEDYQKLIAGLSHAYDWIRKQEGQVLTSTLSLFTTLNNNYESRPFNILRENNWATGFRLVTDYRRGPNRNLPNISVGLEWFNEQYLWTTNVTNRGDLGDLLSDNEEQRRYYNLFASTSWDLTDRWSLTAGFNVNQSRYQLTDLFPADSVDISGSYRFEPIFSPRISLAYQLQPQISLFATVSHGFSAPTLEETLNPDGSLNPDIQPERGWNMELGSRGSYLGGRLSYDFALFRMSIQDLLVARRTALDQYVGINAGKTIHNGLELMLEYQWLKGPVQLNSGLSYSYSDFFFEEFVDREADYSGNQLTGTAPHRLQLRLDLEFPWGLKTNASYSYTDAFPMRDDNSIFSESYQVVYLQTSWTGRLAKGLSVEAYAGINNLFDERYASMILINAASFGASAPRYYYPGLPRNYYGGLRLIYQYGQ